MLIQPVCDILAHQVPHLIVVGTHIGRIFLGIGLALKYNHRNAFIVGPVNGRGNRRNLVGGYNQQVNSCPDKTVNLLDLALIAIVCCGKAQIHVIVEIGADLQFRVLLVSPDVVRALRHPDAVLFRVLRA